MLCFDPYASMLQTSKVVMLESVSLGFCDMIYFSVFWLVCGLPRATWEPEMLFLALASPDTYALALASPDTYLLVGIIAFLELIVCFVIVTLVFIPTEDGWERGRNIACLALASPDTYISLCFLSISIT